MDKDIQTTREEEIKVGYYRDCYDIKSIKTFTLPEALDRIRTGTSRSQVEKIRATTKEDRMKEKEKLPCVTFAGTFSEHLDAKCTKATGLAPLDWDHVTDPAFYRDHVLNEFDFIQSAWISPSGDGVKALARVPVTTDPVTYKQTYTALMKTVGSNPDPANSNISRYTFESYDPDIRTRELEKTSVFEATDAVKVDQVPTDAVKVNEKIFNDVLSTLGKWGLVYVPGKRQHYIINFACQSHVHGIPEGQAVDFALKTFTDKEEKKIRDAVRWGYENSEAGKDQEDLQKMLTSCIVDTDKPRPDVPVILSIDGEPVATLGSISTTLGRAKTRKTHFNIFQASAFLCGTLGNHESTLPEGKDTVLFFDTEQDEGEAWDTASRIKTTAQKNLDRLKYYSLRPHTPEERLKIIDHYITTTSGVGVVFIDGIRDLVNSINNEEEATRTLTALLRWSKDFRIHIFCTLHFNKNDNNARGHLGTELINKSKTVISLEKAPEPDDKYYSIVKFYCGRGRGFKDFGLGHDDDGRPVTIDADEIRSSKPGVKAILPEDTPVNIHHEKLRKIFNGNDVLSAKEFKTKIREFYAIGENVSRRFVAYFNEESLVELDRTGNYQFKSIDNAKDMDKYKKDLDPDLPF